MAAIDVNALETFDSNVLNPISIHFAVTCIPTSGIMSRSFPQGSGDKMHVIVNLGRKEIN